MKIGILTFHYAHNYGAMLQAYALCTKLKKFGHNAEIVDYRLPYIYRNHERLGLRAFYKQRYSSENCILGALKTLKNFPRYFFRPTKWYKFEFFLNNILPKSVRLSSAEGINKQGYDVIICGSDQIWNTRLTGELIPLYFCDGLYAPKKITYAASNGNEYIEPKFILDFARLFKNLDYVSIREKGLSDFLNNNGFKNTCVLDPVFLLSKEEWQKVAEKPIESNYLLTYSFDESPGFFEFAYNVANKLGKKMIVYSFEKKLNLQDDIKQFYIGGPKEFLGYLMNADFIITNSFHGTAFSIIFRKQFYSIPPKHGRERIDSLLCTFGLQSRLVESDNDINITPLVYSEDLISKQINNSESFIKTVLK